MPEKSKEKKSIPDFTLLIPEYDDSEILNILQKRKYYQPKAVQLAVKEAIKRGLINSEHDLFDEKFEVQPLKFKLFPPIENERHIFKIRKSIARALIICGIIPTVWGFIRLNQNSTIEGGLLFLLGVLWIFLSARLMRKVEKYIFQGLFVILLLSALYVVNLLVSIGTTIFMDFFIPLVMFGFILYGLLFLRFLHRAN